MRTIAIILVMACVAGAQDPIEPTDVNIQTEGIVELDVTSWNATNIYYTNSCTLAYSDVISMCKDITITEDGWTIHVEQGTNINTYIVTNGVIIPKESK